MGFLDFCRRAREEDERNRKQIDTDDIALTALSVLSVFDWITPLKGFVEDFKNDPTLLQTRSTTFFIPYRRSLNAGWNAQDIEELLDQHNIKHWGSQITNGYFFLSVPREYEHKTRSVLLSNNIPIGD